MPVNTTKGLVMIKRNDIKSTLIRLVLLGSFFGACNLPGSEIEDQVEEPVVDVQQEEVSLRIAGP